MSAVILPTGDNFTVQSAGTTRRSTRTPIRRRASPLGDADGGSDQPDDRRGPGRAAGRARRLCWFDKNNDGLQDSGDTGVAGVTVDLLNGTGTSCWCDDTNASGVYGFTNLAAGTYEVQFILPTVTTSPSSPRHQHGDRLERQPDDGITAPVTLTAGQTNLTIDAAWSRNRGAAYVCSTRQRWSAGQRRHGRRGSDGRSVEQHRDVGARVTTTNASGVYGFTNLRAARMRCSSSCRRVTTSPSVRGTNTAIDSNANQTTGITAPVTLTAGQTNLRSTRAGRQTVLLAELGDYVWFDTNRTACRNTGRNRRRCRASDSDLVLNATGTSGARGRNDHELDGLLLLLRPRGGTYEVQFILPKGDTSPCSRRAPTRDRLERQPDDRHHRSGR